MKKTTCLQLHCSKSFAHVPLRGGVARTLEVKMQFKVNTYLCEVEPAELAVTNNGYLSTLQPEITQYQNMYQMLYGVLGDLLGGVGLQHFYAQQQRLLSLTQCVILLVLEVRKVPLGIMS